MTYETNRAISPRFAIRIEVNGLIVVVAVVAVVEEYRYSRFLEVRAWRARLVKEEWICMVWYGGDDGNYLLFTMG